MINLISYEKGSEIKAGRANTIIRSYIFLTLLAAIILSVIVGVAYFTLNISRATAQQRVNQNASEIASYDSTKQSAEGFRSDLSTAKQIIDNEVIYSNAYVKIAQAIPSGVVLDSLQLDAASVGKPIALTARAKNESNAIALKTSLESNPSLFSNVYFDSITLADKSDTSAEQYPVSISISVTLTKDALK